MCANVTLKLCANDIHFCAQMKIVRKRNFRKMCANVIAPLKVYTHIFFLNILKVAQNATLGFSFELSILNNSIKGILRFPDLLVHKDRTKHK